MNGVHIVAFIAAHHIMLPSFGGFSKTRIDSNRDCFQHWISERSFHSGPGPFHGCADRGG